MALSSAACGKAPVAVAPTACPAGNNRVTRAGDLDGVRQMAKKITVEKDIPIPMRDGTLLKADLYRPDGPERLPVLLNRTPYGKSGPMLRQSMDAVRAALNDYNVLIQDCRGRYRSEGTWTCF